MTNGNGSFIKTIFWTLILASFGWTTITFWAMGTRASAIEESVKIDTKEIVRIDTNQKEVIKKVDKILDNQEGMVKLLTRLETKIERIQ